MSPRLQPRFAMHPVALAGLVALTAFAAPAFAQDTATKPENELERVEVTGTRASLQRSLALKRNAAKGHRRRREEMLRRRRAAKSRQGHCRHAKS